MKPILFNTDMVRAILAGRKTVTRRVVKPQPEKSAHSPYECCGGRFAFRIGECGCTDQYIPPYRPGDILYVRETFDNKPVSPGGHFRPSGVWYYKADGDIRPEAWRGPWRPSIHMPREAARIFLRVTDVRVERLQDITEEQAQAEGAKGWMVATDRDWDKNPNHLIAFRHLWDSTIKKADRARYGWAANPWVWVIEFERCEKPEGGRIKYAM